MCHTSLSCTQKKHQHRTCCKHSHSAFIRCTHHLPSLFIRSRREGKRKNLIRRSRLFFSYIFEAAAIELSTHAPPAAPTPRKYRLWWGCVYWSTKSFSAASQLGIFSSVKLRQIKRRLLRHFFPISVGRQWTSLRKLAPKQNNFHFSRAYMLLLLRQCRQKTYSLIAP